MVKTRPKRKEYNAWVNMRLRCLKPSDKVYYRYGGRGIKICKRWMKYKNSIKDMGPCPEGLSLERIDNDRHYTKKNCCWASKKAQCNNRSTNRKITFKGETHNIGEWTRILGVGKNTIRRRLEKGHPIDTPLPGRWG